MANDTAQPGKPTVVYSPLRLNWKNVVAGTVIGLLIVTIGVFAFSYYNPDATPIPPVVIKSGTQSAKVATKSAIPSTQKDETADWKTYENNEYNFSLKFPNNLIQKSDSDSTSISVYFESADYKRTEGENTALLSGFSIKVFVINTAPSFTLKDSLENETDQVKLLSKESTKLDGSEAYVFEGIELPFNTTNAKTTEVLTVRKNKQYIIRVITVDKSEGEGVKLFNQMVSTFKFLD